MITYDLSLERQNLLGADKFSVAAHSNETVSFRFHFDRSWRIFETKAAVFRSSDGKYYVIDIRGNCVTVPWEVLRSSSGFDLALVAYENEVVLTSKKVRIAVSESLLPEYCRQLSPTETLFDRMKAQAVNEAYEQYRDEIRQLKHSHANELIELGQQLEAERSNTAAVAAEKDAQIQQLNYQASCVQNEHNAEISALQAEIAEKSDKSEKWDMVDDAISKKTHSNQQLWSGSNDFFELPFLDTSSITQFSSAYISSYLTSVGFDVSSATTLESLFSGKNNLKSIKITNSENIASVSSMFDGCTRLINADLGNLESAISVTKLFYHCYALETVSLGEMMCYTSMADMFNDCRLLREINGTFSSMVCNNSARTFYNCVNLEEVRFGEECIRTSIDFGYCTVLSKESIYSIARGLSSEVSATVTLNEHALTTNLTSAELSEIRSIARTKGWTISYQ